MSAERGDIVLAAIGNTASGHSRRSWECPDAVLPDRAWYLPTFSQQLNLNKLPSLSHGLEHQTQPLLLSPLSSYSCHPYPLYRPPILPTPYSCHPIPYTRQLTPVILCRTRQCSTPYTVDPKPQALDPTPLALQSIPHPCALKPYFKAPPPLHLLLLLPFQLLGLL
jgi:hypothetical protein